MNSKLKFNLPLFAFLFIGLTLVGCKKDNETIPEPTITTPTTTTETEVEIIETTVEEDKENIQLTLDNMLVCAQDMTSSRAIDVLMRDFLNMSEGSAYNKDWSDDLSSKFENVFDFDHIETNSRFNIVHHAGAYAYNHTSQSWEKSPTSDNIVTVNFPTTPEMTENNGVIVIDKYIDQSITLEGETYFAPKEIHAQLNVAGEKLFELNLYNVTYDANSTFEMPVEVDASLFMEPMTIDLDVVRNSNTEFNVMLAFNDENACDMSIEVDLELADDDFENLSQESIEKVHAKVTIGDLSIQSLANIADLIAIEEPTESEMNTMMDLDVFFEGMKIADLEYDEMDDNFVLHYKDATTESAATYVDSFMDDLEALVVEFTGEW